MAKILTGIITAVKTPKTVTVEVELRRLHPLYGKIVKKNKKYKVHNENMEVKNGDRVEIVETRPVAKDKHFKLIKVVDQGKQKKTKF